MAKEPKADEIERLGMAIALFAYNEAQKPTYQLNSRELLQAMVHALKLIVESKC